MTTGWTGRHYEMMTSERDELKHKVEAVTEHVLEQLNEKVNTVNASKFPES